MNMKRLLRMIEVVEGLDESQFNMDVWAVKGAGECGTVGCIAGWAAMDPELHAEGLCLASYNGCEIPLDDLEGRIDVVVKYREAPHRALISAGSGGMAAFLDIPPRLASKLFVLSVWPTPKIAAAALRFLLDYPDLTADGPVPHELACNPLFQAYRRTA